MNNGVFPPILRELAAMDDRFNNHGLTSEAWFIRIYEGEMFSARKAALKIGISYETACRAVRAIDMNKLPTIYTVNGKTGTLRELADSFGIRPTTVYSRLARGLTVEEALTRTVVYRKAKKHFSRLITFRGETRSVTQWANHLDMDRYTLVQRLNMGWSVEKAFLTEVRQYHRKNST